MLATATHRMQQYTFLAAEEAKRSGATEQQATLLREALSYAQRSRAAQVGRR